MLPNKIFAQNSKHTCNPDTPYRVQAFCRRQNLAPGRIHSAPAEIKSGAPDGGSRTGPNFAEEIAKQLGK